MFSRMILRVSTQFLHCLMGGMAAFCVFYAVYAAWISKPDLTRYCLYCALKFGIPAAIILYYQIKYLDKT